MPSLTYLIPFASLADRQEAWDAFAGDPDWIKLRHESLPTDGQLAGQSQITLLSPASFSPIQ
jgi:hypothetical protein